VINSSKKRTVLADDIVTRAGMIQELVMVRDELLCLSGDYFAHAVQMLIYSLLSCVLIFFYLSYIYFIFIFYECVFVYFEYDLHVNNNRCPQKWTNPLRLSISIPFATNNDIVIISD